MSDPILKAAVQAYALAESATRLESDGHIKALYRFRLDEMIGTAHHYGRDDLAACLLILALAEDRTDGPAVCLEALKHAAARLDLPLVHGQGVALD